MQYYSSTVEATKTLADVEEKSNLSAANLFKAVASGLVNPGGKTNDIWTLDQTKSLTNVQSGI